MSSQIIATIGDVATGVCSSHQTPLNVTGTISTGYNSIKCDNKEIARIGDTVTFSCGHTGIITTGSSNLKAGNIAIATLNSQVGPGSGQISATITSCNANSKIN